MIIETERLILREYTMDDFEVLFEILSDAETMQHYPSPFDEEKTRGWIRWNLGNYEKYGFGLWAVVLKETGGFIGDCGITMQNIDGEMLPEIGYHIHKKYWRKGYGKEAARAVCDWVFKNTDSDVIYSYMKNTNIGSYRTAISIGMKKVKEYPDSTNTTSYVCAISRQEWEKNISISFIDEGQSFDWGKTSEDYAKYRDIYPEEFYQYILKLGLCKDGQKVLDIGTGTGVLPRNMYKYGAKWTGTDIADNQIEQAKRLAQECNMNIDFSVCKAEDVDFPDETFDVITACQCIWYPDHKITAPKFAKMLKSGGKFLILYMGWLPFEDDIAGKSEEIILKYNPKWTGCNDTVHPVWVPDEYTKYFEIESQEEFRVDVPFTRETWHGRMRACRGVGAAMSPEILRNWDEEHWQMLMDNAPENFCVKHYISVALLSVAEKNDNSTPMPAKEYDRNINMTIPYYSEFYYQTLDVVEQCGFTEINWLDLGCGTGSLEEYVFQRYPNAGFVLADPSEKMLEQARIKLRNKPAEYICCTSDSISFSERFEVITAIQSHHYMSRDEII